MKLSYRDRTVLQLLGIVGVSALTITTMFYPHVLGNEHSLVAIEEKKASIEELNGILRNTESNIQGVQANLTTLQSQAKANEDRAERLRKGLESTNFTLHMPSLLISLEQKAKALNLDLVIEYDDIQKPGENNAGSDPTLDPSFNPTLDPTAPENSNGAVPDGITYPGDAGQVEAEEEAAAAAEKTREERLQEIQERKKQNEQDAAELGQGGPVETALETAENEPDLTTAETEPEKEAEKELEKETAEPTIADEKAGAQTAAAYDPEKVDTSAAFANLPNIPGINVSVVPVRVTGSYANVRSFIQYLDEIDFMEHNFIDLHSYGDNVSGIIVFNVFHNEEGGGFY